MGAFLEILKAILFGIVEGVTEWLPVSSTGHMILLDEFVHLKVSAEFYEMFQVVIQLGAILAVILLFFHKLNPFSPKKDEQAKKNTWQLWFKVVVAVIPSAVIGLLLDDWMDAHLYNYVVVAITLIVYGVAFIYMEKLNTRRTMKITNVYDIDYRTAILIGAFQCLHDSGCDHLGRRQKRRRRVLLLPGDPHHAGRQRTEAFEVYAFRCQRNRHGDHRAADRLCGQFRSQRCGHQGFDGIRPQAQLLGIRCVQNYPGRIGSGIFPGKIHYIMNKRAGQSTCSFSSLSGAEISSYANA